MSEKPAHILFVTSRLLARRFASVGLADRLARHGHRITFAGPPLDRPGTWPARAEIVEIEDFRLGGPTAAPLPPWQAFRPAMRRQRLYERLASLPLARTRAVLGAERYDLVLIDHELHPHIIAALGAGQRVALYADIYAGPAGLRAPPLSTALVPAPGRAGSRLRVGLSWAALWADTARTNLRHGLATGGVRYRDILRRLARREGVHLSSYATTTRWLRPFEWYGLPLLILQPAELDFPRRADAGLIHVGPQTRAPDPEDDPVPEPVAVARAARAAGKRVIYIGFGSIMAQQPDLVVRIWAAIAARPDWVAIHSLGGGDASALPASPETVHLFPWVPQREVLGATDVAVNHAGIGTILECVEAEVPMLCVGQVNDQPGCAARVAYHGIGLSLPPSASSESIGRALDRLLAEDGFRTRARRMGALCRRYADDRVAEHAVDRLVSEQD